jgi:hypothetical protein
MTSCESNQQKKSYKEPNKAKLSVTELLGKVRSQVRLVQRTFGIMEAILSVFYGALVGTVLSNYDKGWGWIIAGFIASAVYLPLLIIKVRSQWILPDQIFEHLDAKLELNAIEQELARKKAIDGFIDQTIKTLNSATCRISNEPDQALCHSAVADGLADVLSPLINRTQIILDCNTSKFAVGAKVYHNFKREERVYYNQEMLIFRDDVGIRQVIPNDLEELISSTGVALQLRQTVETVVNENRLVECEVKINDQTFQLIGSPVPIVCNEEISNGALWIICECLQPRPRDLENILLIFGRVVANWLSKYDECLNRHANQSKFSSSDADFFASDNEESDKQSEPETNSNNFNEGSQMICLQQVTTPEREEI